MWFFKHRGPNTVHTPGNHEGIQGLIYFNKTLQNVIMGCKTSQWQICPIGFSNQEWESSTPQTKPELLGFKIQVHLSSIWQLMHHSIQQLRINTQATLRLHSVMQNLCHKKFNHSLLLKHFWFSCITFQTPWDKEFQSTRSSNSTKTDGIPFRSYTSSIYALFAFLL